MKTINQNVELKVVLGILESRNRKVRNYLLAETRVEDFGSDEGKEIRRRMDALIKYGRTFGDVTLFREDGALSDDTKELLKVKHRTRVAASRYSLAKAKRLVQILHSHRQARVLLQGSKRLYGICTGKRSEQTIQQAQSALIQILKELQEDRSKHVVHYGQGRTLADIKADFKKFFKRNDRKFVSTGLSSLDEQIVGFSRGDLVVVTAPRGGGKTALALQMMVNQFKAGCNVGFLSLEMAEEQIKERLVANIGEMDASKVRARRLTKAERYAVQRAWVAFEMETAAKYQNRFTPWDVKDPTYRAENIELDLGPFGYDVIVIDYISLLAMGSNDMWMVQKEIGRYLKQLAGRLNCVIVILTQMNKDDGVKYGSGPEEDADWWLRWRYGEEEKQSGQVQIELAKARHGRAVTLNTYFRMDQMRVECLGVTDYAGGGGGGGGSAVTRQYPQDLDSPLDSPLDALPAARRTKRPRGAKKGRRGSGDKGTKRKARTGKPRGSGKAKKRKKRAVGAGGLD